MIVRMLFNPHFFPPKDPKLLPKYHFPKTMTKLSALTLKTIVILTVSISVLISQSLQQQNLCPKACTCDEQNLEIICKGNIGTSGIPHTLNPGAKKIIINNAQTSQFSGLDYLDKLETIDLGSNKISSIDLGFISKNVNLVLLNASHNNINEIKDSLVTSTLIEHGYSLTNLHEAIKNIDSKVLKLTKINLIELVLSHNQMTALKNFSFIRLPKLQRLDLSYNMILSLDDLSLFGLNRLEIINLRGNRLSQVPSLALHSTVQSMPISTYSSVSNFKPSSLRSIDLSENPINSISPDSFSSLEKVQELYLESCSIRSIHEKAFKGLHSINLLSLDNNHLPEVPSNSFVYLSLLRRLKISANNFTHLGKSSFSSLGSLEELQLNDGLFSELKRGVFKGLTELKRLEITSNRNLTTIEIGTFGDIPKLSYIILHSNSLAAVPMEKESQNILQFIDLRSNPLICSCSLKWLTKWLKKHNETKMNYHQPEYATQNDAQLVYDAESSLQNSSINELFNLTCFGPPALSNKRIIDLPENKLECLEPSSHLHVQLGFVSLFLITFLLTFVCLINFCRDKKDLFVMLKENFAKSRMSIVLPYSQNLHKNVDDLKKETQLYASDYEPIEYHQTKVFSINDDRVIPCGPQHRSQYI